MSLVRTLFSPEFRDRHRETYYAWRRQAGLRLRRVTRRLWRPAFPRNADGSVNIHLGCGPVNHPRFINVDAIAFPHVHYVGDVTRLRMFGDATADLIYACHCLEHISHLQTVEVLKEWRRVLKPGGVLRLSVPDFDTVLRIYEEAGRRLECVMVFLMGAQDYAENFHRSAFTEAYLTGRLLAAGFEKVRRWVPGTDEMTTFRDWSGKVVEVEGRRYPISLNLEADRPGA